jgi:hypothetical protein
VKYADDLVLLAKEETVLHGTADRLRYYGMEMSVEETKVIRTSRKPSPLQIMIFRSSWRMCNISTI